MEKISNIPIKLKFNPKFQPEGDGATVMRLIGTPLLQNFDPFLMLDYFSIKLPAGFPDHPHRGFAIVTYLTSGKLVHEDFKGHKGDLEAGDVQVMTSGKGMVHAEMPVSFEEPALGFQLWINLAEKEKYCEPDYKEYKKDDIIKIDKEGMVAKIIIGEFDGVKGQIQNRTPVNFIEIELKNVDILKVKINENWNSFVFIFEGSLIVNGELQENNTMIFFENSKELSTVSFQNNNPHFHSKFIFSSGKTLNEPIFRYGPFVLTTEYELALTLQDFEEEKNGFENSHSWFSKIKDLKFEEKI